MEADAPFLTPLKKHEFDGVGEFDMPDISCFQRARDDPYYRSHILPDEMRLFDWETCTYQVGWEEVYVKDGEIVDLPYGDTKLSSL